MTEPASTANTVHPFLQVPGPSVPSSIENDLRRQVSVWSNGLDEGRGLYRAPRLGVSLCPLAGPRNQVHARESIYALCIVSDEPYIVSESQLLFLTLALELVHFLTSMATALVTTARSLVRTSSGIRHGCKTFRPAGMWMGISFCLSFTMRSWMEHPKELLHPRPSGLDRPGGLIHNTTMRLIFEFLY